MLLKQGVFTVQPKGILVIGHSGQLADAPKRNTFELSRRNVLTPEILTFDELCERAKFIVENTAKDAEQPESESAAEDPFAAMDNSPF